MLLEYTIYRMTQFNVIIILRFKIHNYSTLNVIIQNIKHRGRRLLTNTIALSLESFLKCKIIWLRLQIKTNNVIIICKYISQLHSEPSLLKATYDTA